MKSQLSLWTSLATELASELCTSATRDIRTVTLRSEHEGLSFLTITLPTYGKDLEWSLDQGYVGHDQFCSFSRSGGLPRFLGGFLDLVFDRPSGVLLDAPSIASIRALRQLTLMFSKVLLPCSDARERAAMRQYIETDQEMHNASHEELPYGEFRMVAKLLFERTFVDMDRKVHYGDIVPKHGPGATADKLAGNRKWTQRSWTDRLQETFPVDRYLAPSGRAVNLSDEGDIMVNDREVHFLDPGSEQPVRVISVPKTQKTPRIIAIEPTCMQFMQQGLLRGLLDSLKGKDYLRAMLGFKDQGPNQSMAYEGSLNGELATLDLSEASDRVSNRIVTELMSGHTEMSSAVQATRSVSADVPGHGIVPLAKYASMGSALTFPVEAMVFLTIIFLGIQKDLSTPLTERVVKRYIGKVRVYGDDLIVPVEHVQSVIHYLEAFGLVVNKNKSFWTGRFRESCGKEYYAGQDVSYVKVRRTFPTSRMDVPEIISLVSLRNQLYEAGFRDTVWWLDSKITGLLKSFPVVEPSSPVLGRISYSQCVKTERVDTNLQTPLVRGFAVYSRLPVNKIDSWDALMKCFTQKAESTEDRQTELSDLRPISSTELKHLERSGRPMSVRIKHGWHSPL